LVRPTTPRSPVPTVSAFETIEDSDDDDENIAPDAKNNAVSLLTNGTIGSDPLPGKASQNGDTKPVPSTNMIRSQSATGSLHGAQHNPVAADILRKEPEHETFSRINITAVETPSPDEIEAYKVLQKCLELREKYMFREEVAPWEKEIITDPSTPKPNPNPFYYEQQTKTEHHFEMVDGVIHVYPNKDAKERIYPVADATTFFTDMHYILRVLAAGDIRTVCYKRLNLLEQVILLKWFFQCLYLLYVFEPSNKICEILQWQQKVVQYSRLHAMLIYNLKHIAYKRIPDVAKIFLCI
jgi:AMP deaminase